MASTPKTYNIDHDFETALIESAATDTPLPVTIGTTTYRIRVIETTTQKGDYTYITVPLDEAKRRFKQLVSEVAEGNTRVTITEHGKPLVALVPPNDLELTERLKA